MSAVKKNMWAMKNWSLWSIICIAYVSQAGADSPARAACDYGSRQHSGLSRHGTIAMEVAASDLSADRQAQPVHRPQPETL
jgi:hypothetical protein